jgi:hypothetical protein
MQCSLPHLFHKKAVITISFIGFLMIIFQTSCRQTDTPLFRIVQNNKTGYIDSTGKIIITPKFHNGSDFSEGLAAVRKNGYYGFIDRRGEFAIKPEFDLATRFIKGLAFVYKDGRPFVIDKKGKTVLPPVYASLAYVNEDLAIVTTINGKTGLMNLQSKKLIADTVFKSISDFREGVAVVEGPEISEDNRMMDQWAVIDPDGKFIVPFGKYAYIEAFSDGVARISFMDKKKKDTEGVIDVKGHLLFERNRSDNSFFYGKYHNGLAKAFLYKNWIPKARENYSTAYSYPGYFNLKGEAVPNDTNYTSVSDFSEGRAFVSERANEYYVIDTGFRKLGNTHFHRILNERFKNGYAVVSDGHRWGVIDTSAHWVVKPVFKQIDAIGIIDNYFFFIDRGDNGQSLYGVANLQGKIIIPPVIDEFDKTGFVNGLLYSKVDGRETYFNRSGKIVWQAPLNGPITLRKPDIGYYAVRAQK